MLRRVRVDTVSLPDGDHLPGAQSDPFAILEEKDTRRRVLRAIEALDSEERQAITLLYMGEQTHGEIAEFLGLSRATVNNRLRAGRRKLKEGLLVMTKEELRKSAPSRSSSFVAAVHVCNAAEAGDLAQISDMVRADPESIHAVHPQRQRKELHLAAEQGHVEVVRVLLEAGAEPLEDFHCTGYRNCPLTLAREAGHNGVVALIDDSLRASIRAREDRLDEQDADGNTLLHLAVYHRVTWLVLDLLKRGGASGKSAFVNRLHHGVDVSVGKAESYLSRLGPGDLGYVIGHDHVRVIDCFERA